MRIKLNDDFLECFPEANIHTLVYDDVGRVTPALADRWRARADAYVRSMNLPAELLTAREQIQEWRQAFSQFGLKPSRFRSSIEQLWRRAVQGHLIQTPVSLVNLYCYISILAGSPMGSYDLDRISGDICVRLAVAGEQFTGIGEEQAVEVPVGVVVYADDGAVLCYGWNHRDAACSALRPGTRRAVFFADAALATSRVRAANAITLLREALDEAGATFLSAEILTQKIVRRVLLTE